MAREQDWRYEHITTLSKTCSCMDELVRDMLRMAVRTAAEAEQANIRGQEDTRELLRYVAAVGKILPTDPTEKEIDQRISEHKVGFDTYKALENELSEITICPQLGLPISK